MNYVMLHDTVQFYDDRHQQSGTTQHSWETLDGAQQRAHTSGAIPWWRCRRTRDKLVSCFGTSVNMYLFYLVWKGEQKTKTSINQETACAGAAALNEWKSGLVWGRRDVGAAIVASILFHHVESPTKIFAEVDDPPSTPPPHHPPPPPSVPLCSTASLLPA